MRALNLVLTLCMRLGLFRLAFVNFMGALVLSYSLRQLSPDFSGNGGTGIVHRCPKKLSTLETLHRDPARRFLRGKPNVQEFFRCGYIPSPADKKPFRRRDLQGIFDARRRAPVRGKVLWRSRYHYRRSLFQHRNDGLYRGSYRPLLPRPNPLSHDGRSRCLRDFL